MDINKKKELCGKYNEVKTKKKTIEYMKRDDIKITKRMPCTHVFIIRLREDFL